LGLPNRSPADPAPKDRTSEYERQVILTGYPSVHTESPCDLACFADSAPEGPVMENLTTPLMRFRVPPATSPTNTAPSCEGATALSLSQTLDGLFVRKLACPVSCRRRPWDSKRVGVSHLNYIQSQSSKEAHAIRSPGEPNCLLQCFITQHQLTIPLQRSPLTTPPPKGRSSASGCSRNCHLGPDHAPPPKQLRTTARELRGCTSSAAETASPVRLHQRHDRSRVARAVHQRNSRSCVARTRRSRQTPKRAPQASPLYEAEASQGANTLATSPDKPSASLTIRPCEQRRREADTECRHNRKRN